MAKRRQSSHHTPPLPTLVAREDRFVGIARELESATLGDLRAYWRRYLGRTAPVNLTRSLLYRLLLYRLQAEALGDLDPKTARLLEKIARHGQHADTDLRRTGISPGTTLVREHAEIEHQVLVTEDGYSWNDRHFPSLSRVAHAITGTKWNGPRFFGLGSAGG